MAELDQDQPNPGAPITPEQSNEAASAPAPAQSADFDASGASSASRFRDRSKRAEEGEVLTLTSGETVKVRRPSITNMVKAGIVPANVAGAALKFDSGKPMSDRDVQRLFELKQIVTTNALISPKIAEQPNYDANEIAFTDLTEDEINDIYMYVQVGLEELTKFREKRSRDAAGSDSKQVPGDETE